MNAMAFKDVIMSTIKLLITSFAFFNHFLMVLNKTNMPVRGQTTNTNKRLSTLNQDNFAFIPESIDFTITGRSSDLFRILKPSHFYINKNSGEIYQNLFVEITAAGTVADFHSIPFSFYSLC